MSEELAALRQWVQEQLLEQRLPSNSLELTPLAGDAGSRRYFRVDSSPALLAVEAPVTQENGPVFAYMAQYLRDNGVHSPQVMATDYSRGYLLIEDLGDQLYLHQLDSQTVESLYSEALMTLLRIQQCPFTDKIPVYDAAFLLREMGFFREWFVENLLGYQLSDDDEAAVAQAFDVLVNSAKEQPEVLVHRDFHSRNLLVCAGQSPGVIDFQGAVWGPLTYDLVSLLRDCYICWPREDVHRWALAYANIAVGAELMKPVGRDVFLRWFDYMGLQRHIKVLGIFARLCLRDGKSSYLQDLPLVMHYVQEVLRPYPQLQTFAGWFETQLLPLARRQPWYKVWNKDPS